MPSGNGESILLGGPRLRRMALADGHVTDLYPVNPGVSLQFFPSFLPDGRGFLYSQESSDPARRGLFLGEIGSTKVTRLLSEPGWAMVSPRGYLLFGRQGTLLAQRFDLDHNRLVGDPVSMRSGLEFFGPLTGFAVNGSEASSGARPQRSVYNSASLDTYRRSAECSGRFLKLARQSGVGPGRKLKWFRRNTLLPMASPGPEQSGLAVHAASSWPDVTASTSHCFRRRRRTRPGCGMDRRAARTVDIHRFCSRPCSSVPADQVPRRWLSRPGRRNR